jgi:peptide/nickel transport system substrate-binding protein
VGIQVEVKPIDAEKFYRDEISRPAHVRNAGYGLILAGWTADFPTPASFLAPLVDSRSVQDKANTNYAELAWKQVDETIDAARKAADAAAAQEVWRKVAELARGTAAYVPLVETRVQLVSGQRLRNGVVMQPYGSYDLATAGVL